MNTGKINFKYTPEQIEIVKKMGSNNRSEALAAQEALAAVLTQPVLQIIEQAPVLSNLFKTIVYDESTPASIPLSVYFDVRRRNYLNVWAQAQSGGTATNFVQGLSEMFVNTYKIESAVSMKKSYLKAGRLDVVAASMERVAQEILLKQELNAGNIMLAALAGARIDGQASNTAATNLQVVRSATAGVFQLDDFNTLMTKYARIVASWVGGTPVGEKNQITDIIGSPELYGQVRSLSYNPVNVRSGAVASSGATALAAPESLREEIFRSAGIPSIYGVNIIQNYDFGIGRAFNTVFSNYAGSTVYTGTAGSGTAAFAPATEQIAVGLNANMFNLVRMRERGANGEFTLVPDDQYNYRSGMLGYFGELTEGYVSLDGRGLIGLAW